MRQWKLPLCKFHKNKLPVFKMARYTAKSAWNLEMFKMILTFIQYQIIHKQESLAFSHIFTIKHIKNAEKNTLF